jgi:hypothetical protein
MFGYYLRAGTQSFVDSTSLRVHSYGSAPNVVIKNTVGTYDLTQWQNSSGTVLVKIDSYGQLSSYSGLYANGGGGIGAALLSQPGSATLPAIIARGYTSQSANLQEWQSSSGTILASVDSSGIISGKGLSISSLTNTTNAATVYNSAGTPVFNVDTSLTAVNLGGGLSGIANNYGSSWGYDSSVNAGYITFQTGALGSDSLAIRRTNHVASGDYTISTLGNMRFSTASGKNFNFNNGNIGIATTAIGTNNKIIVNPYSTVDNLATVQINTNAATNKGLVVQGYASQTASIQEWQDASGYTVAKLYPVNPGGDYTLSLSGSGTGIGSYSGILIGGSWIRNEKRSVLSKFGVNTGEWHIANNPDASAIAITDNQVGVFGNTTNLTTFTVKGYSSQTANLQEWQDNSGTVLTYIRNDGLIGTSAGINATGNYTNSFGGTAISNVILAIKPLASNIGLVVRGASSQTANLQEWQNSSGTVLAKVTSTGMLDITPSSGSTISFRDSGGGLTFWGGNSSYYMNVGLYMTGGSWADGRLGVDTQGAANKGIVIRGTASQTANLQEWQNSSGTVNAYMRVDGFLYAGGGINGVSVNAGNYLSGGVLTAQGYATTQTTSVFRAVASQTASITEWQNSGGSVIAKINNNGVFQTVAAVYTPYLQPSDGSANAFLNMTGSTVLVDGWSASTVKLTVKGYTSQTANLQEWQDSSGNLMAVVKADGGFRAGGSNGATKFLVDTYGTLSLGTDRNLTGNPTYLFVQSQLTTDIGAIIKGASGQTADLQQWQNSAGTNLVRIDPSGHILTSGYISVGLSNGIVVGGSYIIRTNYSSNNSINIGNGVNTQTAAQVQITNSTTSIVGLIVKAASSQTANLQEWQNSSGTVLNAVNASGNFIGGQFDTNGNLTNVLYIGASRQLFAGNGYGESSTDETKLSLYGKTGQTSNFIEIKSKGGGSGKLLLAITPDGSLKGGNSSTISANTATTVDTVALSSFTTIEYVVSIKQGSKIRSSKVLVHTDGTSVDSTEYGIMEMGGGITGIIVTASVSGTDSILQVTITDAATTNATVKLIKTML